MRHDHDFRSSLLLITFCSLLLPLCASAQVCRVSAGQMADGTASYIEVFEYDFVSEKPEFPGGDSKLVEFINAHRRYPAKAYKAGIQGRVACSFVVNTDGSITNVTVLKSVERSLNEEATRIFSIMPAWTPGKLDGVTVPVRVVRCVPFRK